jgi:hypothetical protein
MNRLRITVGLCQLRFQVCSIVLPDQFIPVVPFWVQEVFFPRRGQFQSNAGSLHVAFTEKRTHKQQHFPGGMMTFCIIKLQVPIP